MNEGDHERLRGVVSARPQIFPSLTGLRALAAYLVYIHHYPNFANSAFWARIAREGYVGVSIFFVLSGFLLQHRFGEGAQPRWTFLREYFRRRFARIYPLYFLVCLISLFLAKETRPLAWIFNLTLLKGFSDTWKFSYIAQAWSLTVEECFYVFFPWIAWATARWRFAPVALCVGVYAVGVVLFSAGGQLQWEGFFANWQFVATYTFFGRAFEFFIGMQSARLVKRVRHGESRPPRMTAAGALISLMVYAALMMIGRDQPFAVRTSLGLMVHNWLFPIGAALLIAGLACERTLLSRVLASPPAVFAGKSSYAFYLLHVSVPGALLTCPTNAYRTWLNVFLASAAIFLLFEDPVNRLLRGQQHIFGELVRLHCGGMALIDKIKAQRDRPRELA